MNSRLNCFFKFNNVVLYKGYVFNLDNFKSNFCDLIVTSPTHNNIRIEYNSNNDVLSYDDYLIFTEKW